MNQSQDHNAPQFQSLPNFRDVAESINSSTNLAVLKPGLFFRSARPDETTVRDREQLINGYGIKTFMDLRTETEHINAAKKHTSAAQLAQPALVPAPDSLTVLPLKIPGAQYANVNLNGKGFERSLIWQLRYVSLAKLITLMAFGYRMEAISIIGREVLQQRGLIGLGMDTLQHSGPEIRQVFDILSQDTTWPVVVHCTQGKDRTGLVVMLVLLLCEINIEAITADYVRSERELEPEKADRMKEVMSIGLDESFTKCPPEFPARIQQHLESKYGGIKGYLQHIGVADTQTQKIRSILLA